MWGRVPCRPLTLFENGGESVSCRPFLQRHIAISKGESSTERLMQGTTWHFDHILAWCRQESPLRRKQPKSWRTPTSLAQEDMLR
jgi:hypothetical protein